MTTITLISEIHYVEQDLSSANVLIRW